jgi:hypothetical protein
MPEAPNWRSWNGANAQRYGEASSADQRPATDKITMLGARIRGCDSAACGKVAVSTSAILARAVRPLVGKIGLWRAGVESLNCSWINIRWFAL